MQNKTIANQVSFAASILCLLIKFADCLVFKKNAVSLNQQCASLPLFFFLRHILNNIIE